jgi:ABC-2 type transport system permease protein
MNKLFQTKFWWIFLLLFLFVINFFASGIHYRFDLTKEKRYTLSSATKNLLRGLDDEVSIDVFLKGDFPAGFKKLANSTEEFLRALKDRNGAKISYRFISPEDEVDGTGIKYGDSLVSLGANPINLSVQIKGGQQQKYIFPVALITYKGRQKLVKLYEGGNRISQVETNNAEAMLEYQFAKSLDELTTGTKPMVAYSSGNGEVADARSNDLRVTLKQDHELWLFDINKEPVIPDTFKVLIVVKPSIQFTEDEKLKIDQFVMRGGSLLFYIDELFAEQDSLRYKTETVAYDRNLNLEDILFRYGVRINPDLVMDLQCDFLPFVVGGTPQNPQYEFLRWNYYPVFEPKNNHVINKNLGLVAARFVNSIDTIRVAGINKTVLLSSSANSRTISTPALISLNENRNTPEDAVYNKSNIPVAVLLEGPFPSLYRNRISKVQSDSLAHMGLPFRESATNSKIIVAADGDLVLNDVSPKDGPLPMGLNLFTIGSKYEYQFANKQFLLNCIEFLTDKPGIIETRNKDIVLRLLDTKKIDEQRTAWQFINIVLPILLIILFGIIYQQIRKRKYAGR